MKADDERLANNEEYKRVLESYFTKFSLNLELCSPQSLGLSQQKLIQLFTQVEMKLPPHLANLASLKVTLQASTSIDESGAEIQSASTQIFSPHSIHMMVSYEAKISVYGVSLEVGYLRPLGEIRKVSLQEKSDDTEEFLTVSTVLNPVIFIVDDDFVIHKSLTRLLTRINPSLTIRSFNDGSEVVEFYTKIDQTGDRPCSLIFMDKQMPKLNGVEAAKQIRAFDSLSKLKEIPIVAITAQTDLDQSELRGCGITGFCFKPFSEATIREILSTHHLLPPRPEPDRDNDEDTEDVSNSRFFRFLHHKPIEPKPKPKPNRYDDNETNDSCCNGLFSKFF